MNKTIIALALTSILAACGSGSDGSQQQPVAQDQQQQAAPVASEQQKPVEQVRPVAQERQQGTQAVAPVAPEQPKLDPIKESDYLDPMSQQAGLPFEAEEEQPIGEWEAKYLNQGVVRAILEYKMVGEPLKAELAAQMGEGFDAWIKRDVERCVADTEPTLKDPELRLYWVKVMCTGQAYGYWGLVNGTSGTEGTPRQCLEQGKCGFIFEQYDTNPVVDARIDPDYSKVSY